MVFVFKGTSNYGSGDANIYLDDVVVEEAPSCLKPKNLTLATDGSTVTVTWTDAANANIDINGTVTNNVTSPYEFNVELSTTYTVKAQGNCGDALSVWTDAASITTPNCIGGHSINYTLNDSYGDGWNGASITVMEGCDVLTTLTVTAATDLTPNTPYAWQVKGVCDDDESGWSSSFFKTKDDMLVFATDGNWNVVANWTDADGNAVTELPTIINNVRIDAAATIPAGELAVANKATIGTGFILIKDGGQLKQNSASLRVTMEKEIAGYGENDGYYYFIASPFNGRTLYETSGSFSHVENMLTGEYDLYAFDPTADLEWINYKSSSTHVAFQAENGLAGLLYGEGYLYANQEGTTIEFEGTAGKMSFRNSSSLYIPQNGNDYAVVRAEASGEMPVSFKAEHNGTYTLSFSNENVEFSYLHLINNMTGNDIDLLANPSYTFDAKTTDYASRFKLVFAEGNSDDNFAFFSNGSLVISNEGNATMNVYDVTGRLVNTQSVNGSCQVELNALAGVYMIQLVNGDNTKTQKIVVK